MPQSHKATKSPGKRQNAWKLPQTGLGHSLGLQRQTLPQQIFETRDSCRLILGLDHFVLWQDFGSTIASVGK